MSKPRRPWVALALSLFMVAGASRAAVLHVPSQYATINHALDAAAPGDSVLVAAGVYSQYETRLIGGEFWISSVAFLKSGVTLVSESGAAATMLRLDGVGGMGASPVVIIGYGQPGMVAVQGFTFTGTVPHLEGENFHSSGRLILRDCVFRDMGVGLSDEGAAGSVMADLEVHGCRFENINGAGGSAINQTSGTLLLEDSEFVNCRSGAIRLRYEPDFPHGTGLTARRCRFLNNVQTLGGAAGLSVNLYSSVLIEDCWFEGNQSIGNSSAGGAISGGGGPAVVIRNNTFVGNSAELGQGGAVGVGGASVQVIGNTFWGNSIGLAYTGGGSAIFVGGGACEVRDNVIAASAGAAAVGFQSGTMLTGCNVFWQNSLGNAAGFTLDPSDLVVDPLFCNAPAKDLTVSAVSPCLPGHGDPSCTELIGAWGQGCGVVSVEPSTWGKVKSIFRSESEVRR